ncbi:hypothetical protein JMJ77_0006073, partial [Colletotrichum scovillei]
GQETWRPCPSPVQSIPFPAFPSSLRRVAPGHLQLTCLLHLPPLLLVATSLRRSPSQPSSSIDQAPARFPHHHLASHLLMRPA